jgi:tetratricopeptide (TPR) repeat protein
VRFAGAGRVVAVLLMGWAAAHAAEDAFTQYQLGVAYREMGDNRRATLHLQNAIQGGFRNLGARVILVEAAFDSHQSAVALEAAKEILSPSVRSAEVLLRIGRLLFDHVFYKPALQAFDLAHQAAPEAFEPRFRMALTHYLLKQYADTVADLQTVPDLESNAEAVSLYASAEAESGQREAAVSALQRAIKRFPQSPHAYINLALLELDTGNSGEAEKLLEQLRSLRAGDAKVFYTVNRNSCKDFAAGLDQNAGSAPSPAEKAEFYYQLAAQLQQRFHYASAVELIRLAQANEGYSARVLYVAGSSCLNLDAQAPEPVRLLQAAVARDPKSDKAYYMLGRAQARRGHLDGALEAYQLAAKLAAQPAYLLSLGRVLAKSDPTRAMAAYEQALALNPSDAEAHLESGRLLFQMKKFPEARAHFEKALALEPDYYEADYLLARLLYQAGDDEQSRVYMASFQKKKSAMMEQSVVESGFIFGGQ